MGELMDISEVSGRPGNMRAGRAMLLLVAAVGCTVAAGTLVIILRPELLQGPGDRESPPPSPISTTAPGHDVSSKPADPLRATSDALRKETFDILGQLMADFPGSSDPIGLMATVHDTYDNSAESERWWRKCLELDPKRADVYLALGVIAMKKGKYQEAGELSGKARQIDPNLPGVHRRHAEALLELGKPDEALAAIEKEIDISPGVCINHILLGQAHLQRKEYKKAREAYETAVDIPPRESLGYYGLVTTAYYGLATACSRLGETDKTAEYMGKFRKLRTEEDKLVGQERRATGKSVREAKVLAETLTDAGRVYYGHRQFLKAERLWQRAAKLDPANTFCRQQLADMYTRAGRPREGVKICEQLIKIDPKNATYALMKGALLARLKRFDAAEQAMRKVIELAPKRAVGYRSLVKVLLLRKETLAEAKAVARKVVELEPTAGHYSLLGEVCYRNGDRAGALAAFKRAAELAPDNEEIRRAYKRLRER